MVKKSSRTTAQLTLFAGDTHANPLVFPGTDRARMMTGTSGQKCCGSWLPQGPVGLLLKTLLVTSPWASTKCFLTWKVRTTPQHRLLYQLVPSMPRNEGIGSGLWQTITVSTAYHPASIKHKAHQQLKLSQQVNNPHLWPAPTANEDAAGTPNGKMQKMLGNHPYIRGTTPEEWKCGSLNPRWVEWLMGYPDGWTDSSN